jgi:hypothetical protein
MGLSVIDAIKSGKRFRRKGEMWFVQDDLPMRLTREDILATDWEIEGRKIEITESEFDAAWDASKNRNNVDSVKLELKRRLFEK